MVSRIKVRRVDLLEAIKARRANEQAEHAEFVRTYPERLQAWKDRWIEAFNAAEPRIQKEYDDTVARAESLRKDSLKQLAEARKSFAKEGVGPRTHTLYGAPPREAPPKPPDEASTPKWDRIIELLDMSAEDVIALSEEEFAAWTLHKGR